MTAGDNHSLCNIWSFPELIQMQLSEKVKIFFSKFSQFSKSLSNIKPFEKKMTLIAYALTKLQTVKDMVRQIFKEPIFRAPFDNLHVKMSEAL